jgi:hypothetical protein
MLILQTIAVFLPVALAASTGQEYLSDHRFWQSNIRGGQSYDTGLFTPPESLEFLSESQFSTLGHPLFPNHSVRIKKIRFYDGTVRYSTSFYPTT